MGEIIQNSAYARRKVKPIPGENWSLRDNDFVIGAGKALHQGRGAHHGI